MCPHPMCARLFTYPKAFSKHVRKCPWRDYEKRQERAQRNANARRAAAGLLELASASHAASDDNAASDASHDSAELAPSPATSPVERHPTQQLSTAPQGPANVREHYFDRAKAAILEARDNRSTERLRHALVLLARAKRGGKAVRDALRRWAGLDPAGRVEIFNALVAVLSDGAWGELEDEVRLALDTIDDM